MGSYAKGRHVTRRALLTGATAGGAVALAAACGSAGGQGSSPPRDLANREAKITFMYWTVSGDRFKKTAEAFQRKFPRVQVELVHQPADFHPKLQAMFAAGTPPETWALELQKTQFYGKMGVVQELGPYLARDKSVRKEDIPPLKLKQLSDTKGNLLGLSPNMSGNFILYNLNLFQQEGLPDPYDLWKQDKWTWEAFLNAARRLTKRDAAGKPAQLGSTQGIHRLWMNTNGAEEFDSFVAPTKCLYDRPEAIEALEWLADVRLKQRVFVTNAQEELGFRNARDAFRGGGLAMFDSYISDIYVVIDIADFKWAAMPYPKKKDYVIDSSGSGLSMSKQNKEPDLSWEWIRFGLTKEGAIIEADNYLFVTEPEGQKRYLENLRKTPGMIHTDTIPEALKKYGRSRLLSVNEPDLIKIINEGIAPVWRGEQPASTAARGIAQRANEFLKTNPQ